MQLNDLNMNLGPQNSVIGWAASVLAGEWQIASHTVQQEETNVALLHARNIRCNKQYCISFATHRKMT